LSFGSPLNLGPTINSSALPRIVQVSGNTPRLQGFTPRKSPPPLSAV
jgi:hypothetical protein